MLVALYAKAHGLHKWMTCARMVYVFSMWARPRKTCQQGTWIFLRPAGCLNFVPELMIQNTQEIKWKKKDTWLPTSECLLETGKRIWKK